MAISRRNPYFPWTCARDSLSLQGRCGLLLAIAFFTTLLSLSPALAEINDEAFLFSATATQKANRILQEIARGTNPSKDVQLRTIPSLPSNDSDGRAIAERLYREQRVRGLLILVVKQPSQLILTSGNGTLAKLPKSEEVRSKMLAEFRAERYDNGLLQGLRSLQSELQTAFPLTLASNVAGKGVGELAESATDRLTERMAKVFGIKKQEAAPAEDVVAEKEATPRKTIGFEISNWFFVLMFSVCAWMLFPWDYFGGKRQVLARGRLKFQNLKMRLSRGRVFQNLRGAGPGPTAKTSAKTSAEATSRSAGKRA